jgi:hypothetical protein
MIREPTVAAVVTSRPMARSRWLLVLASFAAVACGTRGCKGRTAELPTVQGPDGRMYRVVDKGLYKAFYSMDGRLQRIEYDNNSDGHPDQIDHHDGNSRPVLTEVDENSDGRIDRREHYDESGHLLRVEAITHGKDVDLWIEMSSLGAPARRAFDTDGDGKPDRTEILENGRLVRLELDGDRNGRVDRWQTWRNGVVVNEDIDTDGDGRPDRRLAYDPHGKLLGLQQTPESPIPASPAPPTR